MHAPQVNEVFFTSKTLLEYKMSLTTLESAVSVLCCFLCAAGIQDTSHCVPSIYVTGQIQFSLLLWKQIRDCSLALSSYSPYSVQPS